MDESHFKLLKELSRDNTLSQRDLSKKLGLSLGKVNYVVNALLDKGLVKVKRFKNSKHKSAYMYILTPRGIKKKMELTYAFFKRKNDEYGALKLEIEELKKELKIEERKEILE
jgi:EPS-associated MarR family transcriptional regulator